MIDGAALVDEGGRVFGQRRLSPRAGPPLARREAGAGALFADTNSHRAGRAVVADLGSARRTHAARGLFIDLPVAVLVFGRDAALLRGHHLPDAGAEAVARGEAGPRAAHADADAGRARRAVVTGLLRARHTHAA